MFLGIRSLPCSVVVSLRGMFEVEDGNNTVIQKQGLYVFITQKPCFFVGRDFPILYAFDSGPYTSKSHAA